MERVACREVAGVVWSGPDTYGPRCWPSPRRVVALRVLRFSLPVARPSPRCWAPKCRSRRVDAMRRAVSDDIEAGHASPRSSQQACVSISAREPPFREADGGASSGCPAPPFSAKRIKLHSSARPTPGTPTNTSSRWYFGYTLRRKTKQSQPGWRSPLSAYMSGMSAIVL
jgi:hypothetical protein